MLASVSDLTDEVGSFPRSSEELFLLVRELAMGHEAVRRHLLGSEMAARLAIFVMRDHSLHEVEVAKDTHSVLKVHATCTCVWRILFVDFLQYLSIVNVRVFYSRGIFVRLKFMGDDIFIHFFV